MSPRREKNIVCVDDIEGEYLYHSLESNELTKGSNVALSSSTKNMDFYNSVSIEENYLVVSLVLYQRPLFLIY